MLAAQLLAVSLVAMVALAIKVDHGHTSKYYDPNKIHIHLCPHTHNDPGWLKTVDQYYYGSNATIYEAGVQSILDSVVESLKANPTRKFTYVEMAFFSRWWDEQTPEVQAEVQVLVDRGQLQFANAGWCMHDEANPHYIDMIDQTTTGHRFLQKALNTTAKVTWQIDPFGHSSTQAYLLGERVGYKAMYFGRADFQDYQQRAASKNREFFWHATRSMPSNKLFTGVLLTDHYSAPRMFNWENVASSMNHQIDPIMDDHRLHDYNVPEFVKKFNEYASQTANFTKGSHVMWTMGDDFNYMDADVWFKNMDKLIKYVNEQDGPFQAHYSTPTEYTEAKLQEAAQQNLQYEKQESDFFPYEDNFHAFWTGYFTSRPAFKRFVRTTSNYYTAARQIQAITGRVYAGRSPMSEAMGLVQHHDAVSGTAKQHTTFDYAQRMSAALAIDVPNTTAALGELVFGGAKVEMCWKSNISECPATAKWGSGGAGSVIVWNQVARGVNTTVEIPLPDKTFAVVSSQPSSCFGGQSTIFPSPKPTTAYSNQNPNALPYTISVSVNLPPLASCVLTFGPSKTTEQKPKPKATPALRMHREADGGVTFSNAHVSVRFGDPAKNGWIESMTQRASQTTISIAQDWCYYISNVGDDLSSQASGAYIFRPKQDTQCVDAAAGENVTVRLVESVLDGSSPASLIMERSIGSWISQRLILTPTDRFIQHEFTVGAIPKPEFSQNGKELTYRVNTSIQSGETFYTDSNGREFQKRVLNERDFKFIQTEPIAGNFYPAPTGLFVNDSAAQLAILTDSSVSVSSLAPGQMQLMVHRRLFVDDGRGVGEPLDETEWITPYYDCNEQPCGQHYGPGLIVRGRHRWVLADTPKAASVWRPAMDELYGRPVLFYSDASAATKQQPRPTSMALPVNLQLATLERLSSTDVLVRVAHQFAAGEDPLLSQPAAFQLDNLLQPLLGPLVSAKEVSLTTTAAVGSVAVNGNIVVEPMDVRTFVVTTK